ncbi:MAG: histidine kinase [Actinomycetia bacterium]|nr:histidine kinase [Actinomycetes bacterium]
MAPGHPVGGGTFAAAVSDDRDLARATGEVVGHALERVGFAPHLAVLFVTAPVIEQLEDVLVTIRSILGPRTLLGSTAVSVIGGPREVEERSAVSLWAARWGENTVLDPFATGCRPEPDGVIVTGGPAGALVEGSTVLLLADPFTFAVDGFLEHLAHVGARVPVVGGLASASGVPGGNRLILDDTIHRSGAVGVVLPPSVAVTTVVSQGCRPIGVPLTVTRGEGNLVDELAGRSALMRLMDQIENLDSADRELARRGLHVGRVIDEHKLDFERGDFLIRTVLGADHERGAVAIGDAAPVGSTLQFQVRDAQSASEDLQALLTGRRAGGVLVFTGNGRGIHLFGAPDHDASAVHDLLDGPSVGGMFCAGEIGPVGSANFVHGFTASMALFE